MPPATTRTVVHKGFLLIFTKCYLKGHTHRIVEDAGYFVKGNKAMYQQSELDYIDNQVYKDKVTKFLQRTD